MSTTAQCDARFQTFELFLKSLCPDAIMAFPHSTRVMLPIMKLECASSGHGLHRFRSLAHHLLLMRMAISSAGLTVFCLGVTELLNLDDPAVFRMAATLLDAEAYIVSSALPSPAASLFPRGRQQDGL